MSAESSMYLDALALLRSSVNQDIVDLKAQVHVLQARISALESQVADIEPMVEARASRTEKLVMMLQLEISRFHKAFDVHEEKETAHQTKIESMLEILMAQTGVGT
jgi:DNA repair exonuclease SbcCD ATPase subunit